LYPHETFLNISATFEKFLEKDFDAKGYANNVIQSRAIGECLEKLADGVRLLDKELHSQVIILDYQSTLNFHRGPGSPGKTCKVW
jgi:hypothetical protein